MGCKQSRVVRKGSREQLEKCRERRADINQLLQRAEQDKLREQPENRKVEKETPDGRKVAEGLFRDGEVLRERMRTSIWENQERIAQLKELKARAEKGEVSDDDEESENQQLLPETCGQAPKEGIPISEVCMAEGTEVRGEGLENCAQTSTLSEVPLKPTAAEREASLTEGIVERNRALEAEVQRVVLELHQTKQAFKGEVESLKTQNRELTQELEGYRSKSEGEKARMRTELESLKFDSLRFDRSVETDTYKLEVKNAHLLDQLECYKTDLEDIRRESGLTIGMFKCKIDSLEKYASNLEQKQQSVQTEVQSLRAENLEMKEALSSNGNELVRLRQKVDETERREQSLQNTVSSLQSEKRDLSEDLLRTKSRLNWIQNTGFDCE
uniref:Uncharacterized protein n=1 Tax=Knipowitschia caucasica TaxID=637954 RepID=A0AAV2M3R8_KNICA